MSTVACVDALKHFFHTARMNLGERIAAAMDRAGLTQKAVADEFGISSQAVSQWMSGTRPDIERLPQLARVLKVSLEWLLTGSGNSEQESTDARPGVEPIPELDVRLAAGAGAINESENQIATWGIPTTYLLYELHAGPGAVHIVTVEGDSMEAPGGEGLRSGDKVAIDTSRNIPTPPGIFAMWDGLGTVIKRLEYLEDHEPPLVRIISDNPKHRTYERTVDEVKIIGRAVGLWRRI